MAQENFYKKITVILFIVNALFWLGIFIYFSFLRYAGVPEYLMLKILLSIEPIIFCISLIGYLKKNKRLYLLTLLFLIANAVLSITDEVGIFDYISLILNLLLFTMLIIQRKNFFSEIRS